MFRRARAVERCRELEVGREPVVPTQLAEIGASNAQRRALQFRTIAGEEPEGRLEKARKSRAGRRKSELTTGDVHDRLESDVTLADLDERRCQVRGAPTGVPESEKSTRANEEGGRGGRRSQPTRWPRSWLAHLSLPPFGSLTHQVTSTKAGPRSLILSIRSYRFCSPWAVRGGKYSNENLRRERTGTVRSARAHSFASSRSRRTETDQVLPSLSASSNFWVTFMRF